MSDFRYANPDRVFLPPRLKPRLLVGRDTRLDGVARRHRQHMPGGARAGDQGGQRRGDSRRRVGDKQAVGVWDAGVLAGDDADARHLIRATGAPERHDVAGNRDGKAGGCDRRALLPSVQVPGQPPDHGGGRKDRDVRDPVRQVRIERATLWPAAVDLA